MIICGLCFKKNENENENGRKMYNIKFILPKDHFEKYEEGIICGSCLYDLIDKDSSLLSDKKIENIFADIKEQKLKFLY